MPGSKSAGHKSKGKVAVIGSGIVGICTAIELQSAGYQVTIFDKAEPARETTYGNASYIAVNMTEPQATPANIYSELKLIFSKNAAFKVTPDHFLAFIPWCWRFLKEARKTRIEKSRDATAQLHKYSIEAWKTLLEKTDSLEMLRNSGYLKIWENSSDLHQAEQTQKEMQSSGIKCELLQGSAIFKLEPALSQKIKHALYYPEAYQLLEPYETARKFFDYFIQQGGEFQRKEVLQITAPDDGSNLSVKIRTAEGLSSFDKSVVCLGVWSKKLLEELNLKIPLESERGYHLTFPDSPVKFKHLISSNDRNVFLTPLNNGMRITGFAEFSNVDSKPVEKRYLTLNKHIEDIIPGMKANKQEPSKWMGRRSTFPDSLPVIDLHPQHPQIGMVFGHQHLGITQAPISAKIITALIEGDQSNETLKNFRTYLSAFSVTRF